MARIQQVAPESTTGKAKELLEVVKSRLGMVPNMARALANAPAALDAYVHFSGAVSKGKLSAKLREQIALAVSQANGCDYCLAAHTAGGRMVGLTADQIRDSRLGTAVDSQSDVLLQFARKVVDTRGVVTNSDLEEVRAAGFDEGIIAEVVANVALNVFTNYFNNVVETDIDFPKAEELAFV